VIAADEVAARPAQHGRAELFDFLQDIGPKAMLIRQRRAFVENTAVDAAAEVFDKRAKNASVDMPDCPVEIDADQRRGAWLRSHHVPG
jgi:hypothetical protein